MTKSNQPEATISDGDLLQALGAPLPPEASISFNYSGKVMSGYKAQYVVDRLNSVLGFMWDFDIVQENGKYMLREDDDFVGAYCALTIYITGEHGDRLIAKQVKQWGESSISDDSIHGDKVFGWPSAYKAAMTDALCKCASWLGVGGDAYKGIIPNATPKTLTEEETAINAIKKEAKLKGLNDKALSKLAKETLDRIEKVIFSELNIEELNKILEAVKA
jgi:hypothetical protein